MTDRRITEYAIAEGPEADVAAEIATKTHFGVLEGVEIDFRHPLLPVTDWHASSNWDVWSDGWGQAGVLFPSEAVARPIEEMRETKGIPDTYPTILVAAGDKISVVEVIIDEDDRRMFDHAHDKQTRLAILQIARADGSTELLCKPMIFHGATQLRNGAWRLQFDNMLDRIRRYNNVDSVFDNPIYDDPIPETGIAVSGEKEALLAARDAYRSYFALSDALDSIDEPIKGRMKAMLRNLANNNVRAAILLGKVEARRADELASKTINAGRKLGKANANQYWIDEAVRLWADNPTFSLNNVAKIISLGDANDKRSIMKAPGVNKACPDSSPSWQKVQEKIILKGW